MNTASDAPRLKASMPRTQRQCGNDVFLLIRIIKQDTGNQAVKHISEKQNQRQPDGTCAGNIIYQTCRVGKKS